MSEMRDAFGRPLSGQSNRLSDDDRETLGRLEAMANPTGFERSRLAALRIRTPSGPDRTRVQDLTERWNQKAAADKAAVEQAGKEPDGGPRYLR